MIPLKIPLLRTLKTIMAYSMYLIPAQESVLLQGAGSVKKLPALIKALGVGKPLIVTDPLLMEMNLLGSLFAQFAHDQVLAADGTDRSHLAGLLEILL
jgi:hypothetical protein